jgi:hypothetical protein
MSSQSPHLANIPEAVRIAASTDPSTDAGLKQQAIDYLNKVKELCEETWQVCAPLHAGDMELVLMPTGLLVALHTGCRCVWTIIIREGW